MNHSGEGNRFISLLTPPVCLQLDFSAGVGPGMRTLICGKFELGIGGIFAFTDQHFARRVLRSELMLRY